MEWALRIGQHSRARHLSPRRGAPDASAHPDLQRACAGKLQYESPWHDGKRRHGTLPETRWEEASILSGLSMSRPGTSATAATSPATTQSW